MSIDLKKILAIVNDMLREKRMNSKGIRLRPTKRLSQMSGDEWTSYYAKLDYDKDYPKGQPYQKEMI